MVTYNMKPLFFIIFAQNYKQNGRIHCISTKIQTAEF